MIIPYGISFGHLIKTLLQNTIKMREINIPIPNIEENELVTIEVSLGKENKKLLFRLEPINLETSQSDTSLVNNNLSALERIENLKKVIESYDKGWELIQIFAPLEKTNYIHILYRKKQTIL